MPEDRYEDSESGRVVEIIKLSEHGEALKAKGIRAEEQSPTRRNEGERAPWLVTQPPIPRRRSCLFGDVGVHDSALLKTPLSDKVRAKTTSEHKIRLQRLARLIQVRPYYRVALLASVERDAIACSFDIPWSLKVM